jgi:hypothetical protein
MAKKLSSESKKLLVEKMEKVLKAAAKKAGRAHCGDGCPFYEECEKEECNRGDPHGHCYVSPNISLMDASGQIHETFGPGAMFADRPACRYHPAYQRPKTLFLPSSIPSLEKN